MNSLFSVYVLVPSSNKSNFCLAPSYCCSSYNLAYSCELVDKDCKCFAIYYKTSAYDSV